MIPASIRNNNPGAMYPGKSAKKFGSRTHEILRSKDGVHKIATFPTSIHGGAAQFDLLHASYRNMTIEKAISKWCGGFYVSTYIKVLESQGGVKRSDVLTSEILKKPECAIPLAKAMAQQEAGREYPMSDDEWAAAHQMAFAGAVAPAFTPDNDVPTPKPETRMVEAAKTVATVAAPVAAVATAVQQAPVIPHVPEAVTQTLTTFELWKTTGVAVWTLKAWAMAEPILASGLAVSMGGFYYWSKKQQGAK